MKKFFMFCAAALFLSISCNKEPVNLEPDIIMPGYSLYGIDGSYELFEPGEKIYYMAREIPYSFGIGIEKHPGIISMADYYEYELSIKFLKGKEKFTDVSTGRRGTIIFCSFTAVEPGPAIFVIEARRKENAEIVLRRTIHVDIDEAAG